MEKITNKVMLITYADSLGGDLRKLGETLDRHFGGAVGGIHILPFFPSSGDRGFAVKTYRDVDPAFGTWDDIAALSRKYYLMADYMINHISAESEYYRDFLAHKDESEWRGLFIRYKEFWEGGAPTQEQVDAIYKRKPRAPSVTAHFADGSEEEVWCTFGEDQIDINCMSETGKRFIRENLESFCRRGFAMVRLDAFAYATKRAGTSCFFVEPEVWALLREAVNIIGPYGTLLLPEIHEHYTMQFKMAEHGFWVYDFALPLLLINAIYYGGTNYLKNWLGICPRRQFTTLDTHDGIGIVDARDLLPDDEIARTKDDIFRFGANVKRVYSSGAYKNLDIYQVNCTFFSALGDSDEAYLLARAVQFFAPGIPQVYYVGMLAGKNDLESLERTKEGRSINRHNYTDAEIDCETERPVVKKLIAMMRFRNECPAFGTYEELGSFELLPCGDGELKIRRSSGGFTAELHADFRSKTFDVFANTESSAPLAKIVF